MTTPFFLSNAREAARLNMVGATMLARNDPNGAVQAFRGSIQIMEALSQSDDSLEQIRSFQEKTCYTMDMMEEQGTAQESFFVFNKPLLFEVSSSQADLEFYNACIIFNLALTFHQAAVKRGQTDKFKRALYFYGLCVNLVAHDQTASAEALILAVLNNSAHCHFQLGEFNEFRVTMESVQKQAAKLVENLDAHNAPPIFEANHLNEMFLNISLAQEPTTAASA